MSWQLEQTKGWYILLIYVLPMKASRSLNIGIQFLGWNWNGAQMGHSLQVEIETVLCIYGTREQLNLYSILTPLKSVTRAVHELWHGVPGNPTYSQPGAALLTEKLGSGTHLQYQITITNLNTQSPSALPSILFTDHRIVKNSWAHRVLRSLIPPSRSNRRNSMGLPTLPITTVQTDLTNSIAVHEYPSCKRLLTLSQALASAVTHSFISPNGEHVFTVCPREEAIKMWQVWARRLPFPNLLSDEEIKKFVVFEWIVSNF